MLKRSIVAVVAVGLFAACSSSISPAPPFGPQPPASPTPAPNGACKGVAVKPVPPRSVYRVPNGADDLATKCQILEVLRVGAFVVARGSESAFAEEALGAQPTTTGASTEVTANFTPFPAASPTSIPSPLPTWAPGAPTPSPRPSPTPGVVLPLPYTALALVRIGGILHTYDVDAATAAEVDAGLARWEAHPLNDGPTPPPANKVWSLLGDNRQEIIGPESTFLAEPAIPTGSMNLLTDVWRLSTHDRNNDYYMVSTVMSTTPNYFQGPGNSCFPVCRYWTWRRHQVMKLSAPGGPLAATEDLGPKNGVQVDKVTFSVGGSLSGKIGFGGDKGATGEGNAGINASYGTSWDQPHAKTINRTNVGSSAPEWQDDTLNFMSGPTYDFYAWRNITTTSTFTNGRVAIFTLPRPAAGSPQSAYITPDLTNYDLVRASYCFVDIFSACFFTVSADYQEIHITSTQAFPVFLPTFSVDTTSLDVKPKETATFRIRLRSSDAERAKSWQIVKDPNDNNLTVTPNAGSDSDRQSQYQTIVVKAQPGAQPGTTYTLYVNTVPAGGADSLRGGSLRVFVHIR